MNDNDEINIEDESVELVDDATEESSGEVAESSDDHSPEEEEQYSRKVQKRIDKLVYERNIERQQREQLEQRLADLERHHYEQQTAKATNDIAARLAELKKEKSEYLEIGETEKVSEIDDEIIELKLQARLQSQQAQQQPREQAPAGIPPAQQSWLEQNDWFYNPVKADKKRQADNIYLSLVKEGFDPNDSETYDELDRRLSNGKANHRATNQPSALAPDRGKATQSAGGRAGTISREELLVMRELNLDPNNEAHRRAWIANRKKGAA